MNNNNSYLNVIKNLVNLNEVNENSYHQGFPVYVTSRIYPDCILKFINNKTAKLIKRSKAEEYSEFSSGIFGKIGEIQNDYAKIDAYFKGSNYLIPVQEIKIKKEIRRNIAFYKESGLPWTTEEYINCILYSGEKILESSYTRDSYQNTIDTLKNKIYRKYEKQLSLILEDIADNITKVESLLSASTLPERVDSDVIKCIVTLSYKRF